MVPAQQGRATRVPRGAVHVWLVVLVLILSAPEVVLAQVVPRGTVVQLRGTPHLLLPMTAAPYIGPGTPVRSKAAI